MIKFVYQTFLCSALLLAGLLLPVPTDLYAQDKPVQLKTEYKVNPMGIDVKKPRLSWQMVSDRRGAVQTAYQIRVADSERNLSKKPLWDTGKVTSDVSTHLPYEGPALATGQRYYWQVRLWDGNGQATAWSEPSYWEMGLLSPSDWKAEWIGPAWQEDTSKPGPSPMVRSTFELNGDIASARVYASALGLYELWLNGQRVGDQVFTPGWTSYRTRVQYQTYDVTDLLKRGKNAVGAMLGDGWYRGYLAWADNRNIWGKELAFIAEIRVTYKDGRQQVFTTDSSWKASTGPILMSDIYEGETYDARLEKDGWTLADYDDKDWKGVRRVEKNKDVLIAPAGPPVREIEEVRPVKMITTPEGETVFDLGQNMVGYVRLKVNGKAGTTVTLRHAEVLDKEGNFYTANLRAADQTLRYTLKGNGEETYQPRFTFQGFRYVAVEGLENPSLDNLTGVVVHSDITPAGRFETSNPLLNQLQHNIWWGQRGNFLDVPTDCPQRDERLGWTGDAQVFARTAAYNANVAGFFTKWLADVKADQKASGTIPHVIPDVLTLNDAEGGGATGWSDAAVIVPWNMYLVYGDQRILEDQYDSMKRWVEYMRKQAGNEYVWRTGEHFGDWLAFATTRSDYPGATTDKDYLATAFFGYSTSLLQKTATLLGKADDARQYADLLERIKQAFVKEFVTPNGRLSSNTQTAYVLALWFDLLPESMRKQAAARLVEDIRRFDNHLTTGFLGTSYLCPALSANGYTDVAYQLLNQETYPSWLYPVKMGATTIWERWDGIKPDGTFQDVGMNSFNHYAYGAIGDWMYRVAAGIEIDPAKPGYKHVMIHPEPGGELTYVTASHQSMYGEVGSAWKLVGGTLSLTVTVPANTHATVRLPGAVLAQVTESGKTLAEGNGIGVFKQDGNDVIVETGSGVYTFKFPVKTN